MPSDLTLPIMIVALVGAMWWMSRRNRKQQEAAAAFRNDLQPGQEVMTSSGMYGTVVSVDADVITLEVSPGVTSRWIKPAIAKLVETPLDDADDAVDGDADDDWDEDEWDEDEWEDTDEASDDESDEDAIADDGDADNRRG
jgi:preprotein translocase subunit YajC